MTKIAAIQMDTVESIRPESDTTMVLAMEAMRRGYTLFVYEPQHLRWQEGRLSARGRIVEFRADPKDYFTAGPEEVMDLAEARVVLMRQDPPFDMGYLTATYLLERLPDSTFVTNNPTEVRNAPEKLFPLLFKEYTPATLISSDTAAIKAFLKEHGDIVLKPLYGFGGNDVFRVKEGDPNLEALIAAHFTNAREPIIAQAFLPTVIAEGDKRVILVDGEVKATLGRIPAKGDIRANMRVGGTPVKSELTAKERAMMEHIGPELKKRGLLFVGLDLIGEYLIEINLTSPTGLVPINRIYGTRVEADFWDRLEEKF